nr:MAG TPA: hypothetical protein [Caudoviricetes sp.]
MAKPYQEDIDFAFFVVNFGYTKADYNALTERERMFIYKAYENNLVSQSTLLRDAVFNAVNNALRKKGKRFQKLWKKRPKKANKELVNTNLQTVQEIEQREKGWIDIIYKANGMKKPKRKGS